MRPRTIALAAAALVALSAAALWLRPGKVLAAPLVRGTAVEAVYASGTVEAVDRAEVRARAAGPLIDLFVQEGDAVKKGQLLARIDAPSLRFDMLRGRADRDTARIRQEAAPQLKALQAQEKGILAKLAQAHANLSRVEVLVKKGVQPPQEEERARAVLDGEQSQLEANRAQQRDVRILLQADTDRSEAGAASLSAKAADAELRAPFDGVVLVRRVERGESVVQGQSLLRIGDLTRLHLEALVDEADVGRLRVGVPAAVRLLAFDDRVVAGRVARIAPEADRERKSFQVDLELTEAVEGLRPGMTAEINLIARRRDHVLLAPASALVTRAGGPPELRVLRGGRVRFVPVKAGVRDLGRVEVDADVREGELVVLGDGQFAEGQRARPDVQAIAPAREAPQPQPAPQARKATQPPPGKPVAQGEQGGPR